MSKTKVVVVNGYKSVNIFSFVALIFCSLLLPNNVWANISTIKLATTDWCPYSCPNDKQNKGIAYDYVSHILQQKDITADIVSYPWARAIRQVDTGARHGLLTAVHSESPDLLFTQVPMMSYQMCFYGLPELKWQYRNTTSLSNVSLAVIAEYGYGQPLDNFLAIESNRKNVVEISGNFGLERILALVSSGKVDVFIEDKNVFNWHLKHQDSIREKKFKQLGCLAETPFYLALSPELIWAPEVIKMLNREFSSQANGRWLEFLISNRYSE